MFPDQGRGYVEQVYLLNQKDRDRAAEMFLTGVGLPMNQEATEIEVNVIDTTVKVEEKRPIDMGAYILEEYKEILMP